MKPHHPPRPGAHRAPHAVIAHRAPRRIIARRAPRGVVIVVVLLVMVVLLIGAVAMMRAFNTSLATSGNLAFKRDLQNQAERAVSVVVGEMQTGGLTTEVARGAHDTTRNYHASVLSTNAAGIPDALLGDAAFAVVGSAANDIAVADQGVTVRYMVDRLCAVTGLESVLGEAQCAVAKSRAPLGGSASDMVRAEDAAGGFAGALAPEVVYRLSIRVDGPRGTQGFYQTTFTR